MHNDFMAIRHDVPGHDNGTAILRAQPARMVDGHVDDGYTARWQRSSCTSGSWTTRQQPGH